MLRRARQMEGEIKIGDVIFYRTDTYVISAGKITKLEDNPLFEIKQMFEDHKAGMPFKEIAEKYKKSIPFIQRQLRKYDSLILKTAMPKIIHIDDIYEGEVVLMNHIVAKTPDEIADMVHKEIDADIKRKQGEINILKNMDENLDKQAARLKAKYAGE
jgi:hypothetical protein